jgi:hypothetical protein
VAGWSWHGGGCGGGGGGGIPLYVIISGAPYIVVNRKCIK